MNQLLDERVREEFPALAAAPGIAFLDNASTTQKPRQVIEAVTKCLTAEHADPGRGGYPWSTRAAAEVDRARTTVAGFVNAASTAEVVFTAGATAGMNAVALSWGLANLADGDEILVNPTDHASTVRPWLRLAEMLAEAGTHIRLVPYPLTATGQADPAGVLAAITDRTRLVVVTHVHSVYGARSELADIAAQVDPAVLWCYDCGQSAGHLQLDVRALRADFLLFSAHKMFGLPGTGVLYCAPRTHGSLRPFLPGGVADQHAETMPHLLEGGSPNLPGVLALVSAIDFVDRLGIDRVAAHHTALTRRLIDGLLRVPQIEFTPGVVASGTREGYGIVSVRVPGMAVSDVGFVLAEQGVYVRAGGHCVTGRDVDAVRISVHAYTTADEVDRAIDLLGALT